MNRSRIAFLLALTLGVVVSYSLMTGGLLTSAAGQRQDRHELLEALLGGKNPAVQIQAAKALIPYVAEPEVKSAFIASTRRGNDATVRAIAVKVLAKYFSSEDGVQTLLIHLLKDSDSTVRLAAAQALGKHLDDPRLLPVAMKAAKTDRDLDVRVEMIKDLGPQIDQSGVYDLLLDIAHNGADVMERAYALDSLSLKIRERAELRDLFVNGLDDSASFYQLHALKGLVELQDPTLQTRLVNKAAYLVLKGVNEKWFTELTDDAVAQLRRLDPQAAENLLNKLGLPQK
jgi:HEAT repeat protein